MEAIVRQPGDWTIAMAHLDLRHVPSGVLFRLRPKILVDVRSGVASRALAVYPANLAAVTRVPPVEALERLWDEASVMGALLYGLPADIGVRR